MGVFLFQQCGSARFCSKKIWDWLFTELWQTLCASRIYPDLTDHFVPVTCLLKFQVGSLTENIFFIIVDRSCIHSQPKHHPVINILIYQL